MTRNQGIIGEGVDLNLVHTGDLRTSSLVMHLTQAPAGNQMAGSQ